MLNYLLLSGMRKTKKHKEKIAMTKLAFIGFGLIGASIAKSVKAKKPGKYEIFVYDYHTETTPALVRALEDGVVDSVRKDFDEVLRADILLLCAPTLKNISYLETLKNEAEKQGLSLPLISDVGSVKGNIVEAAEALGIGEHFIGGHPMAGSEKTGYDNATDHLLENAYFVLTPAKGSNEKDLEILKEMVKDTGAIGIVLDCETHDRVTAAISHVPHIVAAELVNLVQDSGDDVPMMKMLAAGGFRDSTRIASSSPDMWRSILLSNKKAILNDLALYREAIARVEKAIKDDDGDYIYRTFERAGEFRSHIPNAKGMLPNLHRIYVDIEDKMGAIAAIAKLLVDGGVSIKNIGIIHNREHIQGVLGVEFYDDLARKKAIEVLRENNYTVYDHN